MVDHDVGGAIVLSLEVFSDSAERLHRLPTRSDGTGSADPVTLAGELHKLLDCLYKIMEDTCSVDSIRIIPRVV